MCSVTKRKVLKTLDVEDVRERDVEREREMDTPREIAEVSKRALQVSHLATGL